MFRFSIRLILAAAFLMAAFLTGAHAQSKSNLVVILDGSGSMWGHAGGVAKIVSAKKVMAEILKDVPKGVRVGFVAYGHRRKGDCTDIETIAHLGSPTEQIATAVQRIQPTGRTPITEALRHAAKLISATDEPSTVLLVSDGIETCQGDPCALAKELRKGGVKLVIHTVGFAVGKSAAEQLQCVAAAGGGTYYDARDSASLRKAIFEVRKAVVENKPAPKPPAVIVRKKPPPTSGRVIILGPGTIKLKPASWVKSPPYQWQAADPETGTATARVRQRDQLRIRAGEYQIIWKQSEHYSLAVPLTEIVKVVSGKTTEVKIDTGLQLIKPDVVKVPYYWALYRPDAKKAFAQFRGSVAPAVVPAGTYRLVWRQSEHYSPSIDLGAVTIAPGKLNTFRVGSGIQLRRASWIAKAPYIFELVKADGKSLGRWRGAEGVLIAPPGKYEIRYRQTEHYHSTIPLGEVTVPAAGLADFVINSGVKFISQTGAKPPYKAIFVNLDSGKEFTWRAKSTGWQPVPLPPGRYKLDWWEDEHATQRMTLLDAFEIKAGTLVEMQM